MWVCETSYTFIVWVPRLHIYEAIYMTDKLCKMFVTYTNVQVNNLNGHATFYNGIYIISTKTQRHFLKT